MSIPKISAFADEITPSFEQQLQSLVRLGISYISLRHINGKDILQYSKEEVQDELLPLLTKYDIKVSSIGSPLGKVDLHDHDAVQAQFDRIPNLVSICRLLAVPFIRVFSYYNTTPEDGPKVLQYIQQMLDYITDTSIVVLHENEKDIFGEKAKQCHYLLKHINHPQFRSVFDSGNFVQAGEDPIQSFDLLEPYIAYIHLKDALQNDSSNVPVGQGDGKYPEILQRIKNNPTISFLTFEPHLVEFAHMWQLEQGIQNSNINVPTYDESFARFKDAIDAFNKLFQEKKE